MLRKYNKSTYLPCVEKDINGPAFKRGGFLLYTESMNIKMHTGCSCPQCRKGMTRQYRREFHRKLRQLQKRQLKKTGEVIDATLSIGYTD